MTTRFKALAASLLLMAGFSHHSHAQDCEIVAGTLSSAQGRISVQRNGQNNWVAAPRRAVLCQGDTVRAGIRSRAAVSLANETVLRIDQSTRIRLDEVSPRESVSSVLRLFSGVIQFFSRKPRTYDVSTTTSTIGIRGTEFVISASDDRTDVTVFEGEVLAATDSGEATVGSGQTASLVAGAAPSVNTLVNPRDQVQWSLFYPPVVALGSVSGEGEHRTIRDALRCAHAGDSDCAFEALEQTPEAERDTLHHVLNAAVLLSVGRVDEARVALADADGSGAGEALRAVVAVAQNNVEEALAAGERAITLSPDEGSSYIAMSYAQQADLQLEAARDTLMTAIENDPDNALAWARLAELRLALGDRRGADDAAARAVDLDESVARTHVVRGFAALARINTTVASTSFERALELDSSDPLAHLGAGLAQIRDGNLVDGRTSLETAVALDSNNALLRPYLGRAYFAERRPPLDAEQYAVAKELDPLDPTAYLFDAIRKHSENQPIDALDDLRTSIANNDNRAVYRGRLQLDQDRAARGVSLAQVFNALGFTELGLNEARRSLTQDPSNASAHRFVADTYKNVRRHEIARVSELFQAQMLQDVNTNPVQPSLSASNLNIASGGPADVGLNEFTPLFESDGLNLGLTALGGENETQGGEIVVSGLYGGASFSLGGLTYEEDGWRDNNQQEIDVGNLFVQAAFTPEFNAQIELTDRKSEEGDLEFRFNDARTLAEDPTAFEDTRTIERDLQTSRIGLRFSPNQRNDILLSHIQTDRETDNTVIDSVITGFPPACGLPFPDSPPCLLDPAPVDAPQNQLLEEEGSQTELQFIRNGRKYNTVLGAASSDVDTDDGRTLTFQYPPPFGDVELLNITLDREIEQQRAYAYLNYHASDNVTVTIGASRDEYEETETDADLGFQWENDRTEDSGKLGVTWRIDERHALRAAAFQSVKPPLVNNRTLEPTQIAGFNQFYDDINNTVSETVALGYDSMPSSSFHWGVEVMQRDLEEPQIFVDINNPDPSVLPEVIFEDREEQVNKLYFNWTPTRRIAASLTLINDIYEAEEGVGTGSGIIPVETTTNSVPVNVTYFSPSGWFAGITVTAVEQEIETAVEGPGLVIERAEDDDSFTVVDLSAGYRLPKRRGVISLDIRNVGDESFKYRDDTYREFRDEPTIGPYFPETTGVIRATFSF